MTNRDNPARHMLYQLIGLVAILVVGWGFSELLTTQASEYWQQNILEMLAFVVAAVSLNLVLGQAGQFSIGHAAFMAVGGYTAAALSLKLLPWLALWMTQSTPALADWLQIEPSVQGVSYADYDHASTVTDDHPDGQAPPMPIMVEKTREQLEGRVRYTTDYTRLGMLWPIVPIVAGGITAALAGLLVGIPCLRLRGDYLAIVTLGVGEVLRNALQNTPYLGASTGMHAIPPVMSPMWVFVLTALSVYVLANLVRSTLGKAILTLREDEIAAEAVGINTTRYKLLAFVIGSIFAGVAGAMLAHIQTSVVPQDAGWVRSVEIIAMVVIGGSGSVTGTVLGAMALRILPEGLRSLNDVTLVAGPATEAGQVNLYVIVGVIAVLAWVGALLALRRVHRMRTDPTRTHRVSRMMSLACWTLAGAGLLFLLVKWSGTSIEEFRIVIYAALLVGMMLLRPRGLFGRAEVMDLFRRKRQPIVPDEPATTAPSLHRSDTTAEVLLDCDHLTIRFGGLTAVDDFNMKVRTGELVGLIGPNGAGKTTVFNLLTGVYAPTEGKIRFDGKRSDGRKPYRLNARGMARTFQNIRLFKDLSVLDNVRIARHVHLKEGLIASLLHLPGYYREEAQTLDEAMMLLDLFGLAEHALRPAGSLPYADQRRLEIARALATRPKLLLLDEPAAGMNPQEKVELQQLIKRIRDAFGLTVLLIEHDMKLVMSVCERITVLDHGQTIAEGRPEQIRHDPKVIEAYLGESAAQHASGEHKAAPPLAT